MIRIIIAEEHQLVRQALQALLDSMPNISVVGLAAHGEETVHLARTLEPDVALIDILMPGMGGLEATERIVKHGQQTRVIALTNCTTAPVPAQTMKAGAAGFLTKDVSADELEEAVRRVYLGKRYVCHDVAQRLANYAFEDNLDSPFSTLSSREMQIMMMVVDCQRVSDISNNLHLSPKTVNSYRYRIFDKLKIGSDVELVLMAVRHGMVPMLSGPAAPPLRAQAVPERERSLAS